MSEKTLNVGVCLADYLKKLKDEKPDFQLGAVSLSVMFKNRESEYLNYAITGDPVLSDDVMKTVCEEDLKDSKVVITEDDPVIIQMTVAMVSKLTKGQVSFTDVIYVPDDVESEEVEVEAEPCCKCSKDSCDMPRSFYEEYLVTLKELTELNRQRDSLRDRLRGCADAIKSNKSLFGGAFPFNFSFLCAGCEKVGSEFCKNCKNN